MVLTKWVEKTFVRETDVLDHSQVDVLAHTRTHMSLSVDSLLASWMLLYIQNVGRAGSVRVEHEGHLGRGCSSCTVWPKPKMDVKE